MPDFLPMGIFLPFRQRYQFRQKPKPNRHVIINSQRHVIIRHGIVKSGIYTVQGKPQTRAKIL